MKFGIIANPKSGSASVARKAATLAKAGKVLGRDTVVAGLDTTSREQFIQCAKDLAERTEVMVVAGGDGTFSDIINAVSSDATLSYMPLGSGCALRYALGLPPQLSHVARQIRDGRQHSLDLILCDESIKAFMASVGLEAEIIHRRETLQADGVHGPPAYAMATLGSLLAHLKRADMTITIDDWTFTVPRAVTAIVTKIAYYGYGLRMVPDAAFDDRQLHLLAINAGRGQLVQSLATALMDGNKYGRHEQGRRIQIQMSQERHAQLDGNLYRRGKTFDFRVLPEALKMWY